MSGLELGTERLQQLRMRLRVDLPLQYLRSPGHSQHGDLRTQRFSGARYLPLDLRLRPGDQFRTFLLGYFLTFLDDLRGALVRLPDDVLRLNLRLRVTRLWTQPPAAFWTTDRNGFAKSR